MELIQHTDEQQYLQGTLTYIDDELSGMLGSSPPVAAYGAAAKRLKEHRESRIANYKKARPRPYFGRVDFKADTGTVGKTYIGEYNIGQRVYSWASPFAGQLFFADPEKVRAYDAPEGKICGRIKLKRNYRIEDSRLLEVTDVWSDQGAPGQTSDGFLVDQLSMSRGGRLRETVATIQPGQYQQIAASADDVLVLQGVAGSGKSIVGLHRIAFLLSPFNGRERINPTRVAFFGPTRNFLNYVAHLLPSLDVTDITQKTIHEWLLAKLSGRLTIDLRETLLEKVLRSAGQRWEDAERAARLKGSLDMQRALDRYVANRYKQILANTSSIHISIDSLSLEITAADLDKWLRSASAGPPNARRDWLVGRAVDIFWSRYQQPTDGDRQRQRKARSEFVAQVRPQVEGAVGSFWPRLDFAQEYRKLLCDPVALAAGSKKRFSARESIILAASLSQRVSSFQAEDLAALCYIDELLNERPNAGFQHVVVDEAQEVSPFELAMLRRHSRGNGFTILGDLAQSLSPQSAESWTELTRLFRGASISRYVVRSSFRSTVELTRFSNTVLKKAHAAGRPAIPFERHGPPPVFSRADSHAAMVKAIADDVAELQRQNVQTIGVLCKTELEATKLLKGLHQVGVSGLSALESSAQSGPHVLVTPIYAVRGMEFDAVIIASASSTNYRGTPLHNRLLYLGVTRAAHQLHVHWFDRLASILESGTTTRRSGSKARGRESEARSS